MPRMALLPPWRMRRSSRPEAIASRVRGSAEPIARGLLPLVARRTKVSVVVVSVPGWMLMATPVASVNLCEPRRRCPSRDPLAGRRTHRHVQSGAVVRTAPPGPAQRRDGDHRLRRRHVHLHPPKRPRYPTCLTRRRCCAPNPRSTTSTPTSTRPRPRPTGTANASTSVTPSPSWPTAATEPATEPPQADRRPQKWFS
jgi:hypothetical protein